MNLPPIDIPSLLRSYGLRPDRSLGQNFLMDDSILQRVVEAAEIQAEDTVLEIGPGVGNLTRYLAASARQVVAVELDAALMPILHKVLAPFSNIKIVQGDILQQNLTTLVDKPTLNGRYLVVANIPYYITSNLIRNLLESPFRPERIVLTIQKEVAQRITAKPGDMSLLALSVQLYGEPHIALTIPAGAFYPPPEVDSAAVRIDLLAQSRIPTALVDSFFRLAKAGFSQKRKTLRNALAGGLAWKSPEVEALLSTAGIDPQRRAETLSLEEWGRLAEAYQDFNSGNSRSGRTV